MTQNPNFHEKFSHFHPCNFFTKNSLLMSFAIIRCISLFFSHLVDKSSFASGKIKKKFSHFSQKNHVFYRTALQKIVYRPTRELKSDWWSLSSSKTPAIPSSVSDFPLESSRRFLGSGTSPPLSPFPRPQNSYALSEISSTPRRMKKNDEKNGASVNYINFRARQIFYYCMMHRYDDE